MTDKEIGFATAIVALLTAVVTLFAALRKAHSPDGQRTSHTLRRVLTVVGVVVSVPLGALLVLLCIRAIGGLLSGPTKAELSPEQKADSEAFAWRLDSLPLYASFQAAKTAYDLN